MKDNIPTNDIRIEHVRSTSIKGLAAKPIIDIDIVHENSDSFTAIKRGLKRLGYYHNGNQGIQSREVFKCDKKVEHHIILDSILHHLYVCQIDNDELQRHLLFRDYLRVHQKEREEYQKLKYKIAEVANQNKKEYAQLKEVMANGFVQSIIEKSKAK